MNNKISNVIGVPIPEWLVQQFTVRSNKGSTTERRDTQELQFLSNKTAWVRVVSSVQISGDDMNYFSKYTTTNDPSSLAKNFILFAGTSKYQKTGESQFSHELRTGISNGSYGMLGEKEVNEYGYVPMPGITSVTIETMGRMGSVRSATINFKAFNKFQLDIVDALYFKLGYTMLLEWGHTYYYETATDTPGVEPKLKSSEDYMIDPFRPNLTKDKINYQISLNVNRSYGNYDGMLGIVTNFNFSRNEDGSYDCSVKMIGFGALAESLKVNRSDVFTDILKQEVRIIVEKENAKREQERQELVKNKREELDALKKQLKSVEDRTNSLLSINEIFEDKIKKNKIKRDNGSDDELIDYLYAGVFSSASDYYNKDTVDVLYDPEKIWAVRKFSTIIDSNTDIASVTLSAASMRKTIQSVDRIKQIDESILNKLLAPFSESPQNQNINAALSMLDPSRAALTSISFVPLIYKYYKGAVKNSDYRLYQIDYHKSQEDYSVYVDSSSMSPYERENMVNSTVRYSPTRKIIIRVNDESLRNSLNSALTELDIAQLSQNTGNSIVSNYNETVIEEVKKQLFEELTTKDIKFDKKDGIIFSVETIDLGSTITEDEVKKNVYTNKLNTSESKRYVPSLRLKNKFKATVKKDGKDISENVEYEIYVYDSDLIKDLIVSKPEDQTSRDYAIKNNIDQDIKNKLESDIRALEEGIKKELSSVPDIVVSDAQSEEAGKFQTAIESALRTIQVYSLNRADSQTTSIKKLSFLSEKQKLARTIFGRVGLYSQFYDKLISNTLEDVQNYGDGEIRGDLLEFYAKYGFNASLMSNSLTDNSNNSKTTPFFSMGESVKKSMAVNHEELLQSYVVPYEVNQQFSQGISLEKPVYVKLGTLLMLINHISLIYDAKDSSSNKTPMFYVDYNPNTNFCLTSLNHLSTNPYNFLIRFSGDINDFRQLFEKNTLNKITNLFNPQIDNKYSENMPEFISSGAKDKAVYRGKVMNVLISIDYLLETLKKFSNSDNTNSVYFKAFMDNVLSDLCKALGNYNMLRLAYNDSANCFYIVDDQLVPSMEGEKQASKKKSESSAYEIPLYGKNSIAKTLEIKTDISTRLSNMIAISANSEKYQASMGTDSTSFGFVNKNFTDRYVPYRGDVVSEDSSKSQKESSKVTEGDEEAAKKFNEAIKVFYGSGKITLDYVNGATNYYITRLSKTKSENPATRASAIIPVSVNFSTDGISGFNMYQSFGINEELLPYTYTAKNKTNTRIIERQVGFCVIGLSHTIENNQWNTSVRSNMIFLKDDEDYKGSSKEIVVTPFQTATKIDQSPTNKNGGGCTRRSVSTSNIGTYYSKIPAIKGRSSNIPLFRLGLTPLTEREIIDDTDKNVFDCGVYPEVPPYFIIHHTADAKGRGTADTTYNTFKERGFPAHYVIDRQGKIHRYLPDGLMGAHVAKANSIAMGVEIIAHNDSEVSQAQTDSAIRLAHYLGFNIDRVLGHGKVSDNKEPTEGYSTVKRINRNYVLGYDRNAFFAGSLKVLPVTLTR